MTVTEFALYNNLLYLEGEVVYGVALAEPNERLPNLLRAKKALDTLIRYEQNKVDSRPTDVSELAP